MSLQRVLIIDDSEEVEFLVRFCAHVTWPEAVLEMYDPRCGMPESAFNWSRYQLLLMDYDLGLENDNGLNWLIRLGEESNLPATIMLTGYASDKLEAKASEHGIGGFLDKNRLTPVEFARVVQEALKHAALRSHGGGTESMADRTQLISAEDKHRILKQAAPAPADADRTQLFPQPAVPVAPAAAGGAVTGRHLVDEVEVPEPGEEEPAPSGERAVQPESIPIIVPGYTITEKIGEGGMASIYLAMREEDDLKVVLKVLNMRNMEDTSLLRRFMREYKLIAQVRHPNIVEIHERAFASEFAYIAMEHFGHGDLAARLDKALDSATAINYLRQITEGLGAAHAKGIVHRDMKPANILFRSEHELAITDFGIAKAAESDKVRKQLTMDGALLGTIYYISPEQIMGREADQRSDLYSLGVIMYKMLTGKQPFAAATPSAIFQAHLNSPIPALPEKYASLQPLVDGLLEKDPDERFQSTGDLLMGLDWKAWA